MPQSRMNGYAKPPAFWEAVRDRIDVSTAVTVVNEYLNGEDVAYARAALAWKVVEKQLPSIQAIAVEVTHKTADSLESLNDRAVRLGLDPSTLFSQVTDTTEKIDSVQDTLEGPHTPDDEQ